MSQSQPGGTPPPETLDDEILGFFKNPQASSAVKWAAKHVAAPIVRAAPFVTAELKTGGGIRFLLYIFDRSISMELVADFLRENFNGDFRVALEEAREGELSALRIGGSVFASGASVPIWRSVGKKGESEIYFHPLSKLPELTEADYNTHGNYSTALNRAIMEGAARVLRAAAEVQDEVMTNVDIDIIILTDGANNEPPNDPTVVREMIAGSKTNRIRFVYFYFDTGDGRSHMEMWEREQAQNGSPVDTSLDLETRFRVYINALYGISHELIQPFFRKPNETPKEFAHRVRQLMRVMSKVSGSKATSAVMATNSVLADDELV